MPKPTVKPVSSSPGLTFEEFRELVGKLRDVSNVLARELATHSGSKMAEKLSRECHDLSVAIVGFWGGSANSWLVGLASEYRLRGLP
jgi:hypothetical protein